MPFDPLAAASLGGFAFCAIALLGILWVAFQSARKGEFVPLVYHAEAIDRLTKANDGLRNDLQANTNTLAKVADGLADLSGILSRHDNDVRERVAAIQAAVEANQRMISGGHAG